MEALETGPAPHYASAEVAPSGQISAVSWGAIFVGALVAASVSLILLAVGSGLGFAAVSPWQAAGISATTSAVFSAIWLVVMQWVSAGVGGFLTGRLRVRWVGTHTHEVFFRDTAHGFVTWSLSTVIVAALVFAGGSALLGAGGQAIAKAASGATEMAAKGVESSSSVSAYGLDRLFRSDRADAANANEAREEAARIIANAIATGTVPDEDRDYLSGLVAAHSGVSQEDAQKRVDELVMRAKAAETKVRAAADAARKAAATGSLLAALSMLVGAFIASVAAALGGHHRDMHP